MGSNLPELDGERGAPGQFKMVLSRWWDNERSARWHRYRMVAIVVEDELHGSSMNHQATPYVGGNAMRPQETCGSGLVVEHGSGAHKFDTFGKFERGRRHSASLGDADATKRGAIWSGQSEVVPTFGEAFRCDERDDGHLGVAVPVQQVAGIGPRA